MVFSVLWNHLPGTLSLLCERYHLQEATIRWGQNSKNKTTSVLWTYLPEILPLVQRVLLQGATNYWLHQRTVHLSRSANCKTKRQFSLYRVNRAISENIKVFLYLPYYPPVKFFAYENGVPINIILSSSPHLKMFGRELCQTRPHNCWRYE